MSFCHYREYNIQSNNIFLKSGNNIVADPLLTSSNVNYCKRERKCESQMCCSGKKKEGKTEDSHLWYLFYLNSLCLGRGASTKNRTERATPSTNHSFCKTPQPVLNHTCSILIPQTLLKSNIVSTRSSCRGQILFDDSFSGSIILAVIGGTCYKFASKNDFSSNTEELISRKTPISTKGKVPSTKVSLCSVYCKRDARQQEDIAEIPVLVPHWSYEIFASQNFSYVHPSLPT